MSPASRREIRFHRPSVDAEELDAVREVLESGWLTTGGKATELEAEFRAFTGSRYAVALNSCTAGLHLALEAVGVGPGSEVVLPTMTFAATAAVACHLGARPVLVDSEPDTLNIDPALAEAAIGSSTRALMPVDYGGHPAELDTLVAMAAARDLPVIEDAAHALPAYYKSRPVGSIAGMTVFSLYATKNVTSAEGGVLCTNDEAWASRVRIMSLHGLSRDAWKRYSGEGTWRYDIDVPGYKYNMPDLLAAIAVVQMRKLPRMQQRREAIVRRYVDAFAGQDAFDLPVVRAGVAPSWHLFVLRLREETLSITRDRFIEEMKSRGVATSVHFIPLHLHPYYRETFGYREAMFPVATREFNRMLSLPLYPSLTDEEVDYVASTAMEIAAQYRR